MYKKKYLFYLLLTCVSVCFSQSRIYLDHNGKEISQQESENLKEFRLIYNQTYVKGLDTITKSVLRNQFGEISNIEYNQIRSLISKRTSTNILDNDYIIIAYIDTLHNYESYVKDFIRRHPHNFDLSKDKIMIKSDHRNKLVENSRLYMFEKKGFKRHQINNIRKREKCKKKIEKKYNAKVFHIFNINNLDEPLENELKWIPDNGIIKQKFLKYDIGNRVIIIKSDGSFYMTSYYHKKTEEVLLNNSDWSAFENQLFEIIKNNSVFKNQGIFYFPKHNSCFR